MTRDDCKNLFKIEIFPLQQKACVSSQRLFIQLYGLYQIIGSILFKYS